MASKDTAAVDAARKKVMQFLRNVPDWGLDLRSARAETRQMRREAGLPIRRDDRFPLHNGHIKEAQRRVAIAGDVIAISGKDGHDYAMRRYQVDLTREDLRNAFYEIFSKQEGVKALNRDPDLCAEANLWMTLRDLHLRTYNLTEQPDRTYRLDDGRGGWVQEGGRARTERLDLGGPPRHARPAPKKLAICVFKLKRKLVSEDAACANCRQWVNDVFMSVNGKS